MIPIVQGSSSNRYHCTNVAHHIDMDIFFSFEPTRYDIWIERLTFHLHCGIFVLEISLKDGLRPSQTTHNQRSGIPPDAGE
jgi:hypothetical protein